MPVPAVPAPPFTEPAAPGCGVLSTTTPILAVLPSPPLSPTRPEPVSYSTACLDETPSHHHHHHHHGLSEPKIVELSELLPTGLKSFPLDAPIAPLLWLQRVGVCLYCLTWLSGSLITFGNYSVDRDIGSGLCYVRTSRIPDCSDMGRMKYRNRRYFRAMTHGLSLTFANSVIYRSIVASRRLYCAGI